MLKIPGVKPWLDIPDPPKPAAGAEASENPFAEAIKMAKKKAGMVKDESADPPPPPPPRGVTYATNPLHGGGAKPKTLAQRKKRRGGRKGKGRGRGQHQE